MLTCEFLKTQINDVFMSKLLKCYALNSFIISVKSATMYYNLVIFNYFMYELNKNYT